MEKLDTNNSQFLTKINLFFKNVEDFRVSIIGWQDGDYFKELCEEDGGIIAEHYQIFKQLPLSKKVNREELNIMIEKFQRFPFLKSENGNYKFHYDLHIWSKKYYLVYNSYLQKLIIKKLNFLEKILFPTILPTWQND